MTKSTGLSVNDVFTKIKTLSKIVRLKEEDNVIRSLVRGQPKNKVLEGLQKKYPDEKITKKDFDNFLYTYKNILNDEVISLQSSYSRRILKQQDGLANALIDLATEARNKISDFQEDGDNTNTLGAIRTTADIFMKVGKLQGIFDEKAEVSVNIQMDKVINEVTTQDSELKNKIMKILKPKEIIVEAEVIEDNE